nr:hypothetical protein [Clostridia bacterium]
MYVSVPKNYSGVAFRDKEKIEIPRSDTDCKNEEILVKTPKPPQPPSDECKNEEKNPLSGILKILRSREKSGLDTEDFLLIGLIALLIGKEGNEDVLLILAMLLLI